MKKIIFGVILVVLGYFVWNGYKSSSLVTTSVSTQSPSPAAVGRKIIGYEGIEGKTALEILKISHDVVTKTSSLGEYVDSIDGIAGGAEGRYWIVYVDSQMANVGADKLITTPAQKIEWKFETEEENGTK